MAGAPDFGWSLIGLLGVLFLIVGGIDLALLWYPAQLGNVQWEFGTATRMLEGMPLVTMGLVLSLGAGVAGGRRWWVVTVSILMLLMALAVLGAVFLFVTDIPLALGAVKEPIPRFGLKRAIAKALVQGTAYPLVFIWLGVRGLVWAKRRSS